MPSLDIRLNLEANPWRDLAEEMAKAGLGELVRIGRLPAGMESGKSTIALVIRMPDGRHFAAETSMALFLAAARAMAVADEPEPPENN